MTSLSLGWPSVPECGSQNPKLEKFPLAAVICLLPVRAKEPWTLACALKPCSLSKSEIRCRPYVESISIFALLVVVGYLGVRLGIRMPL